MSLTPSSRPNWIKIWIDLAQALSQRSTCSRTKVGCVIVSEDNERVLSLGYNGSARGLANGCVSMEPGKCGHLHAEINALVKLNPHDPVKKVIYTTHSPCLDCATAIINARINRVIYLEEYRRPEGKALLIQAGVEIWQAQDDLQDRCPSLSDGPGREV